MAYNCPKCNEIMYPKEDGTCPLCGAQTKEEVAVQIEETTASYQYRNKKLWNPTGFLLISVFFSFIPAAIVYALNCGRLGLKKKKIIVLIAAPLSFAVAITISTFININFTNIIFYALNIGAGMYMRNDQRTLFNNHISSGGKKASYVLPIVGSLVFVGILLGAMIYSYNIPATHMAFAGDDLYYTDNVSRDEVIKMGNYLVSKGVFIEDGKTISFKIDKSVNKYILSMVINKDYINSPETDQYAKEISQGLSVDVLNNSSVEVDFCNNVFKVIRVAVE